MFGSTVGYPSDNLVSCTMRCMDLGECQEYLGQHHSIED